VTHHMPATQLHSLKEAAAYLFEEPRCALTLVSRRTSARRQYYFAKRNPYSVWVLAWDGGMLRETGHI